MPPIPRLSASVPRKLITLCLSSALISALAIGLSGCAASTAQRTADLAQEGSRLGFNPIRFGAAPPIAGMLRARPDSAALLWVVIEGDGRAWINPRQPSLDPTPVDAVGWRLARQLGEGSGAVLYLARPCQYLAESELAACSMEDWTGARFSEQWVTRMNAAIDQAKSRVGGRNVVLAGYSGGGVMAALIAARRDDVAALLTVGAPLDHAAWTAFHHVTPLSGSLSVVAVRQRLFGLPQIHIVGADDKIVPPALMQDFLRAYPSGAPVQMMVLPGVDHRMRAAIDLAAIRSSRLPLPSVDGPHTGPVVPDRSQSK
jgi:pimeloyl-ACP methyl ester carboxylesterase